MRLIDSRRLTGKNVIWNSPGAVADVEFDAGDDPEKLIGIWSARARELLDALGWRSEEIRVRRYDYGASAAISAPIDLLYSAVEIVDWATAATLAANGGDTAESLDAATGRIAAEIAAERNPDLLALEAAARAHGKPFLSDDDEVSVGLGRYARTWPVRKLPASVDWNALAAIPVALVTGTNGKTTSVRMLSAIVRAAGLTVGVSSTDWIAVDDEILDRGDYSGPGGARTVLRSERVDVAILETARGGLLRRGLGVERANAALITNIAEDHLGDFGSRSIDELLEAKWVVTRALDNKGTLVLNAEDDRLVNRASGAEQAIAWFSTTPRLALIERHCQQGGTAAILEDDALAICEDGVTRSLLPASDIPLTLGGIARHNIANALGAAAIANALGIADDAIVTGLTSMQPSDNPGRCNLFRIDDFEVLLDFAHNPDGLAAIFELARAHPAKRRALCFAQAGDRTDESIRELAQAAWSIGLDRVLISEIDAYRRGRDPGEVPGMLREALLDAGARPEQITISPDEKKSLNKALAWAEPGDLVIMLGLADPSGLLQHLKSLAR